MSGLFKDLGIIIASPFAEYENAVAIVHDRYNWNQGNVWQLLNPFGSMPESASGDEVEKVMACYINLCKKRTIPEFQPWQAVGMEQVAKCSGVRQEKAYDILYQLYYATADGTIKSSEFIHPLTYSQFEQDRQGMTVAGKVEQGLKDTVSVLKWVLILGALGYVGYIVWHHWPSSDGEGEPKRLAG